MSAIKDFADDIIELHRYFSDAARNGGDRKKLKRIWEYAVSAASYFFFSAFAFVTLLFSFLSK